MEELTKNLTDFHQYSRGGMSYCDLNFFGDMLSWRLRGSKSYQTKLGAVLSMIYIALLGLMFHYYAMKYRDDNQPIVQFNTYLANENPEADFSKTARRPILSFFNVAIGKTIKYKEVMKNFLVLAVDWQYFGHDASAGKIEYRNMKKIPCLEHRHAVGRP
jgi:hypothetical protein